jgi:hypothetical protein
MIIESQLETVFSALVHGLECEFGRGAGEGLAQRFLDAEDVDFCWEARVRERWLGTWQGEATDGIELDRVAVLGTLDGRWFIASLIIDGEGMPHGLIGRRQFLRRPAAEEAFADAC